MTARVASVGGEGKRAGGHQGRKAADAKDTRARARITAESGPEAIQASRTIPSPSTPSSVSFGKTVGSFVRRRQRGPEAKRDKLDEKARLSNDARLVKAGT